LLYYRGDNSRGSNGGFKEKKMKNIFKTASVLFVLAFFASCSSNNDQATVRIDLNNSQKSIINTASKAIAPGAPSDITEFIITVTGSGLAEKSDVYPSSTTQVTLDIPAGKNRTITVTANAKTTSYTGSVTKDLKAGKSYDLLITMKASTEELPETSPKVTLNLTFPGGLNVTSLGIGSCTVTITGTGIAAPVTQTFTPGTPFTVPRGTARTFSLRLPVNPNAGAVLNWTGAATQDVLNDAVTVNITPHIDQVKLLVPDTQHNRVVQINDMNANTTGTDWMIYNTGSGSVYPSDVDFDSRGRIYIANTGEGTLDFVQRMDDINNTKPKSIYRTSGTGAIALAVDRINDIVYFATSSGEFFWTDLDATKVYSLSIKNFTGGNYFSSVTGIDTDSAGYLYISGSGNNVQGVFKVSTSGTVVASYSMELEPQDVICKNSYIYITDTSNFQIIQLNSANLTNPVMYGQSFQTDSPGNFYRPYHFISSINGNFRVTDTNNGYARSVVSRIVSFNDISGNGWSTFTPTGGESFSF
jgi:hypothetical protein